MDPCLDMRDLEEKCKYVIVCVHACVCVCERELKMSGRPAYHQNWLPLFTFHLQCFSTLPILGGEHPGASLWSPTWVIQVGSKPLNSFKSALVTYKALLLET